AVLADIAKLNQSRWATQGSDDAMGGVVSVSGLLQAALVVREAAMARAASKEERDPEMSDAAIDRLAKAMESGPPSRWGLDVEKASVRVALEDAASMPDAQRPKLVDTMLGESRDAAAIDAAIEKYYGKTKLSDGKQLAKMIRTAKLKQLEKSKDPFIALAMEY